MPWFSNAPSRTVASLMKVETSLPPVGKLQITLVIDGRHVALRVADNEPGSAGLGLAICGEPVVSLGGGLAQHIRRQYGHITGPDATVRLPLADNPAP